MEAASVVLFCKIPFEVRHQIKPEDYTVWVQLCERSPVILQLEAQPYSTTSRPCIKPKVCCFLSQVQECSPVTLQPEAQPQTKRKHAVHETNMCEIAFYCRSMSAARWKCSWRRRSAAWPCG